MVTHAERFKTVYHLYNCFEGKVWVFYGVCSTTFISIESRALWSKREKKQKVVKGTRARAARPATLSGLQDPPPQPQGRRGLRVEGQQSPPWSTIFERGSVREKEGGRERDRDEERERERERTTARE